MPTSKPTATEIAAVAARVRAECIRRGMELQELASRAGISRTTLYHLERGHTGRLRATTLQKIAQALGLSVEELISPTRQAPARLRDSDAARRFDRATNPLIAEVMQDRPRLFDGWSDDDVDELYSTFGTGGPLSEQGVVMAAEAINRKRDAIHKLHVVLETHLRDHALHMIELLYDLVEAPSTGDRGESSQPAGRNPVS